MSANGMCTQGSTGSTNGVQLQGSSSSSKGKTSVAFSTDNPEVQDLERIVKVLSKKDKADKWAKAKSGIPRKGVQERFPLITSIITSDRFESMIGVLIITNCFTMGLEAEQQLGKAMSFKKTVEISEHILTGCFLLEFLLRLLVFGPMYFCPAVKTFFNFVDMLLVLVTGVMVTWILPVINGASDGGMLRTLTVLRALRLIRLVRVVRKVELFHEVYVLLRGLTESVRTLFWTVVVVFFLTYVFAVFGVVLISVKVQEVYEEHVRTGNADTDIVALYDAFGGVFPLMFTLVQVLTEDSWNGIARPLMNYLPMSWLFFYLYLCFAVVALMNLVTAIIVENALAHAKSDEDAQLRKMQAERQLELLKFKNLFELMDTDGDGSLSWPEFEMAFEKPEVRVQLELLNFQTEDLHEVFSLLDTGDGLLSLEEFFEGITRMQGVASAKDTFRIWKTGEVMLRALQQHSTEVQEDLHDIMGRLNAQPRHREGTLRKRTTIVAVKSAQKDSKIDQFDSLDFTKMASSASHISGVSAGISEFAPPPPAAAPPILEDIPAPNQSREASNAREVMQDIDNRVAECKSAVADCSKKVDVIGVELAEIKTTLLTLIRCLQGSIYEKPLRELPSCCGTATSTPSPSQIRHIRQ